jgi:thymidylate kinase
VSKPEPYATDADDPWRPVLELLDEAVERRVLLFGSLPPHARDLDVLARPEEEAALAERLGRAGFANRGPMWVRFAACSALAVELVPAARWSLPDRELAELFVLAVPIAPASNLARPSPAHALLIAARRLAAARGGLTAKVRGHVDRALAADAAAWEDAARRAPDWQAVEALARLRTLHGGRDSPRRRALPRLRRPRRTIVVAVSGLDGSGKSFQAEALRATLARLGIAASVVWSPLGGNFLLAAIGVPAKALLRTIPGLRGTGLAAKSAAGSVMSSPGAIEAGRARGYAVRRAWATLVMFLNALSQRRRIARRAIRGGVVIFDRHALDAVVRARFLYGSAGGTGLQRWVALHIAPRPRFSYFLDVPPDTAFDRKPPDWSRAHLAQQAQIYREEYAAFGARRLDGERPRDELCAEIAAEVWNAWR